MRTTLGRTPVAAALAAARRRWRSAVGLSVVLSVVSVAAIPSGAHASAVYNETSHQYGMYFFCGVFCSSQFIDVSAKAGNTAGTWGWPGQSGIYRVYDSAAGCEAVWDGQVAVPNHGYSVLQPTGSSVTDIAWDDHRADDSFIVKGVQIRLVGFADGDCNIGAARRRRSPSPHRGPAHRLEVLLRRWFDDADRNHDGFIDQPEARAAIAADFERMDVNHDGVINLTDLRIDFRRMSHPAVVKPDLAYYFPFHRGHRGGVHLGEFQHVMLAQVRGMDTNHDGRYSWPEVRAFYLGPLPRTGGQGAKSASAAIALAATAPVGQRKQDSSAGRADCRTEMKA